MMKLLFAIKNVANVKEEYISLGIPLEMCGKKQKFVKNEKSRTLRECGLSDFNVVS